MSPVADFPPNNAGGRDLVAGDIHGCFTTLEEALGTLVDARGREYLTQEERERFLAAVGKPPDVQTFAATLADAGCRISNVFTIRARDFDDGPACRTPAAPAVQAGAVSRDCRRAVCGGERLRECFPRTGAHASR